MDAIYLNPRYLEKVVCCPVCGDVGTYVYGVGADVNVMRCVCGVYYCDYRLNSEGMSIYWGAYQVTEHSAVAEECELRDRMYALDFNYINNFLDAGADVLDVGCADGLFLDVFAAHGHKCSGVEFGHGAALEAAKKYRVWEGLFSELDIPAKFDVVIFRGVLQYLHEPRRFFEKAVSVLKPGGLVFITAQPNMESFCHKLFQQNFRLRLTPCDCVGFSPATLRHEFARLNCRLLGETFFYEESPYADPPADISLVHKALQAKSAGRSIEDRAPAFWGNMITQVFQRR